MKHFHSQNWKQKEIKKKEIELLSYNHFNQIVSLSLPVSHKPLLYFDVSTGIYRQTI